VAVADQRRDSCCGVEMSEELTPEKLIDGMRKLWESPPPYPPVYVCSKKALPVVKAVMQGAMPEAIVFIGLDHISIITNVQSLGGLLGGIRQDNR